MEIEGRLIAADALNCQQKAAEMTAAGKGACLLDAKGNQANLEAEISEYVRDGFLRNSMYGAQTQEKNRDRIETRTAYATSDISWLFGREKRESICCTGAVRTEFEKGGRKSEAWHDDIFSRKLTAKELLRHARMERAAEATRRLPDVHYDEDCCRAENRTVQQNLNLLRKFAISLFK